MESGRDRARRQHSGQHQAGHPDDAARSLSVRAHRANRTPVRARIGLTAALLLGAATLSGGLLSFPAAAHAAADPGVTTALDAECERLRAELGRVNAEITALKRGDRGVRDDYRLRKRLADAEELARRLTASEAELRRLRAPALAVPAPPTPTPGAAPAEAPGVLQARADLLSDQARRLQVQATTFERAAGQLRTRQTLRRRAGHLDRDPFATMEGSKRFMVVPGASNQPTPTRTSTEKGGTTTDSATNLNPPPMVPPGGQTTTPPPSDPGSGSGSPGSTMGPAPPPTPSNPGSPTIAPNTPPPAPPPATGPGATPVSAPTPPPPAPTPAPPAPATPGSGTAQPESTGGATAGGDGRGAAPLSPTTPASAVAGTRAMLDPQTAAELRRMEAAAGRSLGEAERLEQAAGVLSRKARALEEQAKALRVKAQQR